MADLIAVPVAAASVVCSHRLFHAQELPWDWIAAGQRRQASET